MCKLLSIQHICCVCVCVYKYVYVSSWVPVFRWRALKVWCVARSVQYRVCWFIFLLLFRISSSFLFLFQCIKFLYIISIWMWMDVECEWEVKQVYFFIFSHFSSSSFNSVLFILWKKREMKNDMGVRWSACICACACVCVCAWFRRSAIFSD